MGRNLRDVTFDEWLNFVFDHPVSDPAWYWADDADSWGGSPTETARLLARTFRESGAALQRFSNAQVNQGFWYLISNSCSDAAYCMVDKSVPWETRKDCIEGIQILFRDCFTVRCSQQLSHLDEAGADPLNSICYMWWDVLPIHGQPEDPKRAETDALFLDVMEKILELNSDACRESALHGLGEWHGYYPKRIHDIIFKFIWSHRKIRDSLRNYAYAAQNGDVL